MHISRNSDWLMEGTEWITEGVNPVSFFHCFSYPSSCFVINPFPESSSLTLYLLISAGDYVLMTQTPCPLLLGSSFAASRMTFHFLFSFNQFKFIHYPLLSLEWCFTSCFPLISLNSSIYSTNLCFDQHQQDRHGSLYCAEWHSRGLFSSLDYFLAEPAWPYLLI